MKIFEISDIVEAIGVVAANALEMKLSAGYSGGAMNDGGVSALLEKLGRRKWWITASNLRKW